MIDALLPLIFAALLGVSILIYVVLDGFDLGVGLLLPLERTQDGRDTMVGSIGPFWDANETWLVLAVGLLLVAFPLAHGQILTALYGPVFFMLVGLMVRGAAFELRIKAPLTQRPRWDWVFFTGSLLTAYAQGFMLGLYVMGLVYTPSTIAFGLVTGACLCAAYALLGVTWLRGKTRGSLRDRVMRFGRPAMGLTALGFGLISLVTPLVSDRVFSLWFEVPQIFYLTPLPLAAGLVFFLIWRSFGKAHIRRAHWQPFSLSIALMVLAFAGLAYSFYPYIIPDRLKIVDAASAGSSLVIMLVGALAVLPMILAYTAYAYWVFRGPARPGYGTAG